ncbi:TetR/AcrR family transcriptional regulator [Foetidibacter luteolus]|uniref:TetR/AcrR family transcriptional regulator n=1 Tax=Foetidibacter luteolus TaxID=2608880 RepID=UPI00129BBDAF|nr:TetR/AcrR family transcriptional regulator [Foetidibacter luteolus]
MSEEHTTEARILEAAKKVFITRGMAGARMQDIANEAGINKALLHYYFRSKEKLFETIFREIAQRFIPRMTAIFESDLTLFEKIEVFSSEYIDNVMKNPYIPLFVLNELNKQPDTFVKQVWGDKKPNIEKVVAQINEEVARGNIKPVHPLHLLMNLLAMCVFPFVAKPMLQGVTGLTNEQFTMLMEQRKKEVPRFIIESIKK